MSNSGQIHDRVKPRTDLWNREMSCIF